jgi:hypothetical protein
MEKDWSQVTETGTPSMIKVITHAMVTSPINAVMRERELISRILEKHPELGG